MRTLEQKRAAYAWERVQDCTSSYTNLAKGAPAMIMSNGLMQALAFLHSKGKEEHKLLVDHILEWLKQRKLLEDSGFVPAMEYLHSRATSAQYRLVSQEALELLKWIRQFAPAVGEGRQQDGT